MRNEIQQDVRLNDKGIDVCGLGGLRSSNLGSELLLVASQYDYIVIMLGNNDVAPFYNRPVLDSNECVENLLTFANVLINRGKEVFVIGLMNRPDVDLLTVMLVNDALCKELGNRYVPNKVLLNRHFIVRNDGTKDVHLNDLGRKTVRAMIYNLLSTRCGF